MLSSAHLTIFVCGNEGGDVEYDLGACPNTHSYIYIFGHMNSFGFVPLCKQDLRHVCLYAIGHRMNAQLMLNE